MTVREAPAGRKTAGAGMRRPGLAPTGGRGARRRAWRASPARRGGRRRSGRGGRRAAAAKFPARPPRSGAERLPLRRQGRGLRLRIQDSDGEGEGNSDNVWAVAHRGGGDDAPREAKLGWSGSGRADQEALGPSATGWGFCRPTLPTRPSCAPGSADVFLGVFQDVRRARATRNPCWTRSRRSPRSGWRVRRARA